MRITSSPSHCGGVTKGFEGEEYMVAACVSCNLRKATRRYAPESWAERLSELPGKAGTWQVWSGGAHLEARK